MAGEHSPRLLHEVFASVLQRHAAAVAVDIPPGIGRAQRQTCSYAQLDRNAARVHAALGDDQGERVVCLLLARDTPWLYAAQLGVLRAGACYVGLEARNPDEHVRYVLHDAGAKVVLTDAQGCARLRGLVDHDVRLVDVATLPERAAPPPFAGEDARLAYVIYTSGTTGRPKGVMIEHCSVVNLVLGDVLEFGLTTADRVAQGSSPAYDSSVEETWMALSCGACVVPMDDEVVRRGPDLLPWLQDERITVLCPPPTLLRATGCLDPRAMLPELKLLYVGGEALPQELADRWAKGRRMVNGYGPTECTVTVTRSEVREGEPVTIGEAVPGNRALVVDESLHEVSPGDWGELCIVGKGVARGYLGRSDLTAERFMVVPPHGRMYRTGDRVRRSSSGALIYEGRLDAQVKLRGHRVELGEIEARLVAMDGVRAAACAVQDGEVLVAFIVPQDPSASMALDRLTAALRLELPAHMVPARMQAIAALPTTVGGKLDRRALPRLQIVGGVGSRDGRDSVGALEHLVAAAFCKALACTRVPADVDFFDLGGDSLRAAVMISHLRDDARTEALAVRDVYETRTVEALALRAERAGAAVAGERVRPEPEGVHEVLVTGVQTLWLAGELIATASLAYGLVFLLTPFVIDAIGVVPFVFSSLWIFAALRLLLAVPLLAFAVAMKRLLIGRYTVQRQPVWGYWYLRHWIVQRCVRLVPWNALVGTELQLAGLRRLGARIGRNVHLHRGVDLLVGGWDLLEIGDDVTLSQDSGVGLCEFDDGHVVVAPVVLERGAVLEVRAGVDGHVRVGEGACVTALSLVAAGSVVPAGERWDGVPARRVGLVGPVPAVTVGGPRLSPAAHALLMICLRTAAAWFGMMSFFVTVALLLLVWNVDGSGLRSWLANPATTASSVCLSMLAIVLSAMLGLTIQGFIMRFGPRVPAGVMQTRSALHVLALLRAHSVDVAGVWLSGTLFWPWWLRLAGARIGPQAEISTILDVLPENLTVGGRSFYADGIYLGGPRIDRGTVSVAPVELGSGTFLGNHVVIPKGAHLPDDLLLGVSTVACDERMTRGSSWFGQPPFALPRREVIEVDRSLAFEPGVMRYANRVFWEALRFSIPLVPALAAVPWLDALAACDPTHASTWLVAAPLATLVLAFGLALFVLVLKWLLLGRVRPGQHALWSCWCSRWDFLYVAWGMLARAALVRLQGTLWLAWYLRAMGVKIGKRVVLGGGFTQVVDPDMLSFGDYATVDTMFQAHSFEDRVLKIDRVTIEARATLRRSSVVLYGAHFGAGCRIESHSVVMKNERLLPGRDYAGVPTRPV